MRKFIILLLLLCPFVTVVAQKVSVTGKVTEQTSGEVLPGASAVLLSLKDSSMVSGASSATNGSFKIPAVNAGQYILKVSYMGYKTHYQNVSLSKSATVKNVGTIALADDSKMMKEATVTGKLAQVEMKADTFIYNADAYRLPEGAVLEELVKKLPGADVSDDGTIKINGKEVKKILVDGKEFFDNDTKISMKNLPTKMVNKIKAYDKKSDYSRVTGIDDGEEETVLDLSVKKGMKEGWLINLDGAYGTHDRYTAKGNVNRFLDRSQFSLIVSSNNVNDNGFPGGGGGPGGRGGGGGSGIVSSQMAGANFAWENKKADYTAGRLKMGGNARFSRTSTDSYTKTNSQSFMQGSSTWANSLSSGNTIAWNLNMNYRIEWMPDSMTTIMLRPNYSHSDSDSDSESLAATFNNDPYNTGKMTDPLSMDENGNYQFELDEYKEFCDTSLVNSSRNLSMSHSYTNSTDAFLMINRRLGRSGRNITFTLNGGWSGTRSKSWAINDIRYYQTKDTTYTNRYTTQPQNSWNIAPRLSYSEPITKYMNLQFSYKFQYRYSNSDRSMYNLHYLIQKYAEENGISGIENFLTAEEILLGYIPSMDIQEIIRDAQNSQYATYNEYNHDAQIMIRYNRKFSDSQTLRVNAGISFQPQNTSLKYEKGSVKADTTRHTFNWAPRIDVRWKINQTGQLNLRYNGRMTQPNMTNLLEIMDNTNPQNVSIGNAGLTSSWNNSLNMFYNQYLTDLQMGWSVNGGWSQTLRSTTSATINDKATGNKYTRPMNIDGNWSANGNLMFNSAIGKAKAFNVMTNTSLSYSNNVGYTSSQMDVQDILQKAYEEAGTPVEAHLPATTKDMSTLFSYALDKKLLQKATTKTLNIGENLRLTYRGDWGTSGSYEFGANGGFTYQHSRNDLQTMANLDTWSINWGGNFTVTAPWGTSLSMDCGPQYRRGYSDASMNTTEVIWNAQLSQSFLKNKALTISAQGFDLLQQRSNISRTISAIQRSDTYTNSINSYFMFHIIYRLNLVGSKQARKMMHDGPGGPGMMPPDGGGRGERGGGGGGFGGPGGGGPGGRF